MCSLSAILRALRKIEEWLFGSWPTATASALSWICTKYTAWCWFCSACSAYFCRKTAALDVNRRVSSTKCWCCVCYTRSPTCRRPLLNSIDARMQRSYTLPTETSADLSISELKKSHRCAFDVLWNRSETSLKMLPNFWKILQLLRQVIAVEKWIGISKISWEL